VSAADTTRNAIGQNTKRTYPTAIHLEHKVDAAKSEELQMAMYSTNTTGPSHEPNCILAGTSFFRPYVSTHTTPRRIAATPAKTITHKINLSRDGMKRSKLQDCAVDASCHRWSTSGEYFRAWTLREVPQKEAFSNSKLNHPVSSAHTQRTQGKKKIQQANQITLKSWIHEMEIWKPTPPVVLTKSAQWAQKKKKSHMGHLRHSQCYS
jgi:hypothetical protein